MAIGGLTEGFLGKDQALQLEAALKEKTDAANNARRRAKITDARAITGADLLQRIRSLTLQISKMSRK